LITQTSFSDWEHRVCRSKFSRIYLERFADYCFHIPLTIVIHAQLKRLVGRNVSLVWVFLHCIAFCRHKRANNKLERCFLRLNVPGGSYDQGTKQAHVVLRNRAVRDSLCAKHKAHRRHSAKCSTLYMSISRIRRYEAGNVCSRLIEFPALRSFVYNRLEVSTNMFCEYTLKCLDFDNHICGRMRRYHKYVTICEYSFI